MTTGVDEQFGRILDGLRDEGLEGDTIVVFMSDHGNCLGIHGQISKNVHFEESVRIPFIVRWPGRIAPRRDELRLSVPDIAPTLLDLMGLADRVPRGVEGVSHAGLFLGGEGPRPSSQLYLAVPYGQPAAGQRGVRTDRYTLVVGVGPDGPTEPVLHDNREDPYQLRNVAAEQAALVRSLLGDELVPWLERTRDPFRLPWPRV
jgi:arylsulfatase A-like enzyme